MLLLRTPEPPELVLRLPLLLDRLLPLERPLLLLVRLVWAPRSSLMPNKARLASKATKVKLNRNGFINTDGYLREEFPAPDVLRMLLPSLLAPVLVRWFRRLEEGCAPLLPAPDWLLNIPRRMEATLSGSAFSRRWT